MNKEEWRDDDLFSKIFKQQERNGSKGELLVFGLLTIGMILVLAYVLPHIGCTNVNCF